MVDNAEKSGYIDVILKDRYQQKPMDRIYLDYAATAPSAPEVIKAMEPFFFEKFGNASSPHAIGREAHKALEEARNVGAIVPIVDRGQRPRVDPHEDVAVRDHT